MTPAQDAASYAWPPLTPAEYLEDELVFCRDGSLLKDATFSRARCGVNCMGVAAAMTDHAAVPCPAPPTERVYIPRNLRCGCTDAHHYRGSALCPLTPVDPWASSTSHNTTSTEE